MQEWFHLVGTFDGTTRRVYLNGTQIWSAETVKSIPANQNSFTVGMDWEDSWLGEIDEVRISNVERSSNWIWTVNQNVASNFMFCAYGDVEYTRPPTVIMVE